MDDPAIVGMTKQDETKEVKRSKTLYPIIDGIFNLIDTRMILDSFGEDKSSAATETYLELIKDDKLPKNPYLSSSSLYPVIPTNSQYDKPYLTPRRHVEYATFWAGASLMGLGSIVYVLTKL